MGGVARTPEQKHSQSVNTKAGEPDPIGLRITHCLVAKVNDYNQVQVKPLGGAKEELLGGENAWHAVVPELNEVFRRWGQLRPGMFCRAFWTGKVSARHVYYVEILGKEMIFSKKQAEENDIDHNHFKMLSGGGWPR